MKKERLTVLIPVDFSDYSLKACELGFNYAHSTGADVALLHVYYNTFIPSIFPYLNNEIDKKLEEESIHVVYRQVKEAMSKLCGVLDNKISQGELPAVKYGHEFREGLPEEEILKYIKEIQPIMIVMGTRGTQQKTAELIGSITAEIIEQTNTPLLTIPEHIGFSDPGKIRRLAFATSFRPEDMTAFERLTEILKNYIKDIEIQLFNISTSRNEWNEIRLTGFSEYLKKHYPALNITFSVTPDGDLLEAIDKFVAVNKIDVIAFSTRRRSAIMRIFNPSIAHRMIFHGNTPLLVIPI